jgi:hypothetical protein
MFAAKINITCHGNARMRDTHMRSAFRPFSRHCVVHLTKQLLHDRCQYDEYVSLFLYIAPCIDLGLFIFSYMRRMKVLSKQKLREREVAADS